VYFGRKRTMHVDCASHGQAKLTVRLANLGLSGWIKMPVDDTACLMLLSAVDARLRDARRRFEELAASRTSDPRLQVQIVDQLLRWYVHGRSEKEPSANSAADEPDDGADAV
jgi:hypothetical protein